MRGSSLLKVFLMTFLILTLVEMSYSDGLYHSSLNPVGQTSFGKNFVLVKDAILQRVGQLLPGEHHLFMYFDSDIEGAIQRAKIQRKFVMTAA